MFSHVPPAESQFVSTLHLPITLLDSSAAAYRTVQIWSAEWRRARWIITHVISYAVSWATKPVKAGEAVPVQTEIQTANFSEEMSEWKNRLWVVSRHLLCVGSKIAARACVQFHTSCIHANQKSLTVTTKINSTLLKTLGEDWPLKELIWSWMTLLFVFLSLLTLAENFSCS